jgi:hypothetical protein
MRFWIPIIFAFMLCCCAHNDQRLEDQVLADVFLTVVDSVHMDTRLFYPPPKPKLDFKTGKEDTLGFGKIKADYLKKIARIKKDTSKLVIIIVDSTQILLPADQQELRKHFKNISVVIDSARLEPTKSNVKGIVSTNYKNVYARKINLPNSGNDKYIFKYASKIDKGVFDFSKNSDKAFGGILSFSSPKFDDSRKFAVIAVSFSCGQPNCGSGYMVFIKKTGSKWVIDAIKPTWVN